MLIDFVNCDETLFEADICVIGAGAAGFSCAVSLLNSGLKVLIIEGGGQTVNPRAQDLHRGIVVGQPHGGIHEARERIVGGTTTKWGGQALPFMEEDFEIREHVNLSGWPISLKDMEPYYKEAENVLGTDCSVPFNYSPWKERKIDEPKLLESKMELFVTKWCKVPDFAKQHGDKLEKSKNVILLRNANVVELLPTEFLDAVKALKIISLNKKEGIVKARFIIAAGGALETVRLFLASVKFGEAGLGNKNGHVGCYFQDHVAAIVGEIVPASRKSFHNIFDPFYKMGFKYFPRIKLVPSFAKKMKILHASAQIVFANEDDDILDVAKNVVSNFRKKQLPDFKQLKSLLNPLKVANVGNAIFRWKINKRGSATKKGPIWLEIHSEQNPVHESSISLSSQRDELQMPRICLNWVISDLTVETIRTMAKLVKEEFENTNVGKVNLEPWVENDNINPFNWLSDVYHQAGGLRMSNNEKEGVVDSLCKVYGIDNLYVGSSAVFPTSSFSNPTMTTIALTIRICRTIEQRLKITTSKPARFEI